MVPIPTAIMKALGTSHLKLHYVSLGKSHFRDYVEKLNGISLSWIKGSINKPFVA